MTDDNLDDVQPNHLLRPVLQTDGAQRQGLGRMDLSETLERHQSRLAAAASLVRAARQARSRAQDVGSPEEAGHRKSYWALTLGSIAMVALFVASVLTAFETMQYRWLFGALIAVVALGSCESGCRKTKSVTYRQAAD